MKVSIRVKPNSRESRVEEAGPNQLLVRVRAPAQENRANQEALETLARYFRVPRSRVSIAAGLRSKQKIVEIDIREEGQKDRKEAR